MSGGGFVIVWMGVVALVGAVVGWWHVREGPCPTRCPLGVGAVTALDLVERTLAAERGVTWWVVGTRVEVVSYVVPWWAELVAVLSFPVGLIALRVKTSARGSIELEERGGLATAVCEGTLPWTVVRQVERLR